MGSTEHSTKTVAHAFADLMNGHDADAVDGFITEDYVNHNYFVEDGREANRAFWTLWFAAFPDTVPLSVHSKASRPRATRLIDAAAALNELPSNATTLRPVASKTSLPQRSVVSKRTAIWLPRGCKEMPTVGS